FDAARAEYQAALEFEDDRNDATVLCKWSACEFKAGQPVRAEELLQQALARNGNRLAVAYGMLIEVIRLKLPGSLKQRFNREFKEALGEPPTAAGAVQAARTMHAHIQADVDYHGRRTHEKQVRGYLDKARSIPFTEPQLRDLCHSLVNEETRKLLKSY